MNDQTNAVALVDYADFTGDSTASIHIDYAEIIASTEPDQPGGRVVFNTDDYETDEEADAALEAFFNTILEAPYEEAEAG